MTEFTAIRAAQAPRRELKGIKAQNLAFHQEGLRDLNARSRVGTSYENSSPVSVSSSSLQEDWTEVPIEVFRQPPSPKFCRSVDNVAQLSPKSFSSVTPPRTRTSSRAFNQQYDSSLSYQPANSTSAATTEDYTHSRNSSGHSSNDYDVNRAGSGFNIECVPHAVTTPDDTALTLSPLQFASPRVELADVPEEEEGFPWKESAIEDSSTYVNVSPLRHAKSFPSVAASWKQLNYPSVRASVGAQTLMCLNRTPTNDPVLPSAGQPPEDIPDRPRLSRRFSIGPKPLGDSWEDDIDYCYEHAAEADCEFEWDRRSTSEGESSASTELARGPVSDVDAGSESVQTHHNALTLATNVRSDCRDNTIEHLVLIPTQTNPSLLESPRFDISSTGSMQSSMVSVPEVATPTKLPISSQPVPLSVRTSQGSEIYMLNPSLLGQADYESRLNQDRALNEVLVDDDTFKSHLPLYHHRYESGSFQDVSPCSSTFPLSKCTSQESMAMSTASSTNARHRKSSSFESLPEFDSGLANQVAWDIDQILGLDASEVTFGEQGNKSPLHKRSQSLAKEVAHQSLLKKATSYSNIREAQNPQSPILPRSPSLRNRAASEAARLIGAASSPSSGATFAGRMHSASSATSGSVSSRPSRSLSGVSYSLFPAISKAAL